MIVQCKCESNHHPRCITDNVQWCKSDLNTWRTDGGWNSLTDSVFGIMCCEEEKAGEKLGMWYSLLFTIQEGSEEDSVAQHRHVTQVGAAVTSGSSDWNACNDGRGRRRNQIFVSSSVSTAIRPSVREWETGEWVMRRGVMFVSSVCLSFLLFYPKRWTVKTGVKQEGQKSISVTGVSLQRGWIIEGGGGKKTKKTILRPLIHVPLFSHIHPPSCYTPGMTEDTLL